MELTAEWAKTRQPVCECGDWKKDHKDEAGSCLVCKFANGPWPACQHYRFSHMEVPLILYDKP